MAVEPPDGPFEPPHSNGAVHQSGITRARRRRRRIILAAGAAIALAWIVALTYAALELGHSPERLSRNDAASVAGYCSAAQRQLQQLPKPSPVQGADRVARIRAEDAVFTVMTNGFRTVTPRASTPANALKGWITDWSNVIAARERYAHDLAATATTGAKVRLVLPATGGVKPVTDRMNDFVRENHPNLDACFTDGLQLENVEGPRVYKKLTSD